MKKSSIIFVCIMALFVYTGSAHAFNSILNTFNSTYPGSQSGANASCQLCHGGQSTSEFNEYGWSLRQNGHNFAALEDSSSINVNGGTTNLEEINAGTQPGWTTGANNNLYDGGGLIMNDETAPGGIGALDPAAPANQAPIADANGPYSGTAGSAVTFDGSGSSDPDGTIASYDWDFGDGSFGTGVSPNHTYTSGGTFDVTLIVTDNDSAESSASSTTAAISAPANQAPIADANGPYSGTAGSAVTFDGSGSSDPDGTIVSYDWNFGDGNVGSGMSPSHIYASAGTFTVTLTVADNAGGTDSASSTATIVAVDPGPGPGPGINQPPTADANGPYSGTVGNAVTFDGSGSTDPDGDVTIAFYDWDFGDGTVVPGAGPTPNHTYTSAGAFTVTLTVTDDAGDANSAATTATIVAVVTGGPSPEPSDGGNSPVKPQPPADKDDDSDSDDSDDSDDYDDSDDDDDDDDDDDHGKKKKDKKKKDRHKRD